MPTRTEARASAAPAPALSLVQAEELALVFKALADPTRVRTVSLLLAAGESGLCVCDIAARFPLGQPTISHHLRVLREAGLVAACKKGLWVHYSANRQALARLGITLPVLEGPIEQSWCADDSCGPLSVAREVP